MNGVLLISAFEANPRQMLKVFESFSKHYSFHRRDKCISGVRETYIEQTICDEQGVKNLIGGGLSNRKQAHS